MRGLLLNEFYSLRKNIMMFAGLLVFYGAISLTGESSLNFGIFLVLFSSTLLMASFNLHERFGWDLYANILPISRKKMVLSYYVFAMLTVCVASFLFFVLGLIESYRFNRSLNDIMLGQYGIFAIAVVFLAILIPILIKFGTEKGRMIIMVVYMTPVAVAFAAMKMGINAPNIEDKHWQLLLYASPMFLLCFLMISIKMSILLYEKKEF